MLISFLVRYTPLLITVAGAILLSIESYLSLNSKSLCPTKACEVVGKYLTIGEPFLVAAGAVFFWFLALILFFVERYPGKITNWPFYLLASALAIDSSLIGFQFFAIQQKCIICIGVAVFLIVIATLYCFSKKAYVLLTCFTFIWLGGFFVNAIVKMPAPQGAYSNMIFYSSESKITPVSYRPKMTLIMSMNCPHCLEVVQFLSEKHPIDYSFNLVAIDNDMASLQKISTFLQQSPQTANPFRLLHTIKEKTEVANVPVSKDLRLRTKNGLNYLSNIGITSIPVLIYEPTDKEKKILISSDQIINFIDSKTQPQP